jgi:hypothetical protein
MKEVTLLDGKIWEVSDLEERMIEDEFYYGYCNQAMFSNSKIKDMRKSPKTFYYINKYVKNQQPLRDGHLFHTSILEPEKFSNTIFSPVFSKNTKTHKEWKETYKPEVVYTMQEKEDAERLSQAFTLNKKAVEMIGDSQFEKPKFGFIDGLPFRAKADVLRNDGSIIDLKTCQNITNFKKDAYSFGYDSQVYIYCKLFNISYKKFWFIAIDKKSLDIGIYDCSKEMYESGKLHVQNVLTQYKGSMQGKSEDEIKEFIDNYYFTGTL